VLESGLTIWNLTTELGFEHMILTKGPTASLVAWTAKVEWLHEHFGRVPVTITTDKSLTYGRVLVDDFPPYVSAWLKHRPRGLVVMPAQPWNKGYEHPQVIRYDGTNLDQVRERLIAARDRTSGEEA
jgi:5'-nucleotidase